VYKPNSVLVGIVVIAGLLALGSAVAAQEANAPQGPTATSPLKFNAIAVSMPQGEAGQVQINIERWTTNAEREALLTALVEGGQDKLLTALQAVKERTGFMRVPNSKGYELRYCRENILPDGTRQIVIMTDRTVSFLAASYQATTMDYPFTLVEMRFDKEGKGEGKLLFGAKLTLANKRLEIENYGQQPVRLSNVKESK